MHQRESGYVRAVENSLDVHLETTCKRVVCERLLLLIRVLQLDMEYQMIIWDNFFTSSTKICYGYSLDCLIEAILMSTLNIFFW